MNQEQLNQALSRKMQKIARRIEELIHKECGTEMAFGLVIFPWAKTEEEAAKGTVQYVSNVGRVYMAKAMQELVNKWNAGMLDIPHHDKQ